ncbi:HPP family protein [Streptomyces chattanoogensis]|uniref:HPP family protein n=1 Tax=Streptomyces chattanoogensis TaxID=66876 RepID=UPI0036C5C5A3
MATDSATASNGVPANAGATTESSAADRAGSAGSPAAKRLTSKAPPRPGAIVIALATGFAVGALLLLVGVGSLIGQVLLVPPLAASAALVFGAPALPLSQPRSVVGGQLLSTGTGFVVLAVAGSSAAAAAVAGGLALGVMMAARTPHSPAAATAVIVVLTEPRALTFLPLLALACGLLVLVGVVAGRSGRSARYPAYWW